jgi:hypothetical protein
VQLLDAVQQLHVQQPSMYAKPEAASTVLEYTLPDSVQQLHVEQPSTYAKPEAPSAVLGS